jgi:hypothetical protein
MACTSSTCLFAGNDLDKARRVFDQFANRRPADDPATYEGSEEAAPHASLIIGQDVQHIGQDWHLYDDGPD